MFTAGALIAGGFSMNAAPALSDHAHLRGCLEDGASLPTISPSQGETVDVDGRILKVRILPEAMDEAFPDCTDVPMDRNTDVRISVNGDLRRVVRHILNPGVDDGRPLRRTIRFNRSLHVGDRVTSRFVTTASAQGEEARDIDTISFRLKPKPPKR